MENTLRKSLQNTLRQASEAYEFTTWKALAEYIIAKRREKWTPDTTNNYERRWGDVCAYLDEAKVKPEEMTSDFQREAIAIYLDDRKAHCAPSTKRGIALCFHTLMKHAAGKMAGLGHVRVVPERPTWEISEVQKPVDIKRVVLSGDGTQLAQVLDKVAHSNYPERNTALVRVAADGGLRRIELTRLTWADVEFREGGKARLQVWGKGDTQKPVTVQRETAQALRTLRDLLKPLGLAHDSQAVFASLDHARIHKNHGAAVIGPMSRNTIDTYFNRVSKALGFKVTPHALRRWAGTTVYKKHGLKHAQNLLRHKNAATTVLYLNVPIEETNQVLEDED